MLTTSKKKLKQYMAIYVINKVILLYIKYMTHRIILLTSQVEKINIKLHLLYKTTSALTKFFYSSIIHSHIFSSIINFHD